MLSFCMNANGFGSKDKESDLYSNMVFLAFMGIMYINIQIATTIIKAQVKQ